MAGEITAEVVTSETPEQSVGTAAEAKDALLAAIQEQTAIEAAKNEPAPLADNSQAQVARDPETGRFVPAAEVPTKFQKADGSLDEQRLDKSLSALEKLEKYKALERDFHKPKAQEPVAPAYVPPQMPTFPAYQPQQNQTPEMAAFAQMLSVAEFAAKQNSLGLESQLAEMRRDQRLKTLAESDPEFLDERVASEIGKILNTEKPYLWSCPDPYGDAFAIAKGRLGSKRSGSAQPNQVPSATLTGASSNANVTPPAGKSHAAALEEFKKLPLDKQREILMRTPLR